MEKNISLQKAKIQATLGKKHVFIKTDVVDKDIPVSFSKKTIIPAGTEIDFKNEKVT